MLDIHLEMVLEVLADAGQVVMRPDAERLELARVAYPRELEQLRGVDRPAGQDHVSGFDTLRTPLMYQLYASRTSVVEVDAGDERARAHVEVRAVHHRAKVRAGGAQAPAA